MPSYAMSFAELRDAVRGVRAARYGTEALATVRPRDVDPLAGDRGPLMLTLLAARADHRVAWLGPDGFALLERPPQAGSRVSRPPWARLLDFLDRNWGRVTMVAPCAVVVLLGLPALLIRPDWAVWIVIGLTLAMAYVSVRLTVPLLWGLFVGRRRAPGAPISGTDWRMPLFHQTDDRRVDELIQLAVETVRHVVTREVRVVAPELGGQVDVLRVATRLHCPRTAVTTEHARARFAMPRYRSAHDQDGSVTMLFDERPTDVPVVPRRIHFFRWFSLAVVLSLVAAALSVKAMDSTISYYDAQMWVLHRLVWRDPPGPAPAADAAAVWELLLLPILPLLILVGWVATRARNNQMRLDMVRMRTQLEALVGKTRVLIVTVADIELTAVLSALRKRDGVLPEPNHAYSVPVFEAGVVGGAEVYVIQVEQGAGAATGVAVATASVISALRPHYAVITGICWGLRPDRQALGDICVSTRVRDLDHRKVTDHEIIDRGENPGQSPDLVHAFRAAKHTWLRSADAAPVHLESMLALNTLVNSPSLVEVLRARYPEAGAADMEGAAFYAVTRAANVPSILVKAICDWGKDKNDDHHVAAANNSAAFLVHALRSRAFARSVDDKLGL